MMDDRARTHESGHACLGRIVGREPSAVVVFGDTGHTRGWIPGDREVGGMTSAEFRALMEAHAICNLAGEAALEVFGDPDPRDGAQDDRAKALISVRSLDPKTPGATLDRLYLQALALAREHRDAIARFAETLAANHDRLAGHEVAAALAAAFGGWPTPRFDPATENAVVIRRRELFELGVRDGQTFGQRLELRRAADGAARAGVSLAEFRGSGLYSPLKGA